MREALYFTGQSSESINLSKDVYVAKGATLHVSADLARKCEKNKCEFNVGFIGFRSPKADSALSTYGLISIDDGFTLSGNTISFAAMETTKQGVLPVTLKMGQNKLTFTIDPYKKTRETNEGNNTFSVTVVVSAAGRPALR
jgi:hypothetical protein